MDNVVITYGTFDLFHIGHLNLLKRAKSLGNKLIVAISTDEFNEIKGKRSIIPYEQRVEIVKSIKYVDLVIPEKSWEQKVEDIKKYNVDILVMGKDWKGKFDFLNEYCKVVYLPRTEGVSTTKIKKILNNDFLKLDVENFSKAMDILSNINFEDLKRAFEILMQIKADLFNNSQDLKQ